MKHLSRDEMKKVMGGYMQVGCGKCCFANGDCSRCLTGLTCSASGASWSSCDAC